MSTTLVGEPDKKPKRHGVRYPWDEWFRMRNFILVRGTDYHVMTHSMAGMIRNIACSERYRVSVGVYILSPKKIRVKVFGPLGPKGQNGKGRPHSERPV